MEKEYKITRKTEKAAIIFYQYIRQNNCGKGIIYQKFLNQWMSIWKTDFNPFKLEDQSYDEEKIDFVLKPIYAQCFEKWNNLSKASMRNIRAEFTKRECLPPQVYRIAEKRGLKVHKSYSKCMGVTLGGFCIYKTKNNQTIPILGKNFELRYHDVCQFLNVSPQDESRWLNDFKRNLGKGYLPKGTKPRKKKLKQKYRNPNPPKQNKEKNSNAKTERNPPTGSGTDQQTKNDGQN